MPQGRTAASDSVDWALEDWALLGPWSFACFGVRAVVEVTECQARTRSGGFSPSPAMNFFLLLLRLVLSYFVFCCD